MKNFTDDDEERYRKASALFQHAWMSNAKWRKVLTAIATAGLDIRCCQFKCIDSDYITETRSPEPHDIGENRFNDGKFQPFEYKWLEWLRFPRLCRPKKDVGLEVELDLEALREAIELAADARLEIEGDYLWVLGYTGRVQRESPT